MVMDSDFALALFFVVLLMAVAARALWWMREYLPGIFNR